MDTKKAATDSLIGKVIYGCYLYPNGSFMAQSNPVFFDMSDASGKSLADGQWDKYFHKGDKLEIVGAEALENRVAEADPSIQFARISLAVKNQTSGVSAGVVVEAEPSNVRTGVLYREIVSGTWFSSRPVGPAYPKIGMLREDVICSTGMPDHENHDQLSGDQMVYFGGKMYVYTSAKTGRVVNVQDSY